MPEVSVVMALVQDWLVQSLAYSTAYENYRCIVH